LVFPCEAEPMHVVPIDLIERRVMALAEIASVRHPLLGLVVGIEEPLASDVAVALSGDRRARGGAARGRARGGIRCFAAASTEERKRQPQRYGQAMSRQGHVGPRRIELLSCSPARVPRGPRRLYPASADGRSPTTAPRRRRISLPVNRIRARPMRRCRTDVGTVRCWAPAA